MKEIVSGVVIENEYDGVTLGAVQTPNGVIMIDAPISMKDAQIWRSSCSHNSGSERLLVLLDEHYDRTMGARALRCPIIAHEKTAQAISGRNSAGKPQATRTGAIWESVNEVNSIHWAHPEITFTNEMSINWDDEEPLILEHHPGPARGAIWAVLPERKVIFLGDALSGNQPPFLAAADLDQWIETLELLKGNTYKDYILISSRGGMVNRDEARDLQKFLKKVQRLADKTANSKSDLAQIEEAGASLADEFKAKSKAEMEIFRTRLAYGFSQYCLNFLSKKVS
ncbi:MAG: hypothetical protein PWQ55_2556 [Chloroflexota bacterium]|nr:hypothetical protein [Chloroflexota bacterium]